MNEIKIQAVQEFVEKYLLKHYPHSWSTVKTIEKELAIYVTEHGGTQDARDDRND